jgi:DNA-binding beta-propeller fold protein YncE
MTATNPDVAGNVTLLGAAGAVLPNSLVIAANASQGLNAQNRWLRWFLPAAYAQEASPFLAQTTAAPDGSFKMALIGQVGETLQVTQTVDGEKSPPTDLTIKGTVVDLGVPAQGVVVDESTSTADVTGGREEEGLIFALALSSSEPLPSLPDPLVQISGVPGIGSVAVDPLAGTGLVVSTAQNILAVFSLDPENETVMFNSVFSPLAVDVLPAQRLAAIGVESGLTSVSVHDSLDGSFECSFLIVNSFGAAGHVRTPFVRIGSGPRGDMQIVAVSEYSDGTWLVSRTSLPTCFDAPVPNGMLLLPPGTVPGGMDILASTDTVLVSDTAGNQLLVVDFVSKQITPQPVGVEPQGVKVDEANGRAFVVNSGEDSITLLDLEDFASLKLVGVGLEPTHLAVDGNLKRGLLLSEVDGTVIVVDLDIPLD